MEFEDLKKTYEGLFELTEDETEFRYFKTKKEYATWKKHLLSSAEGIGCRKELENYIRCREFQLYEIYELRRGLKGHRLRPADDYERRDAQYLWYPYIPLEEYTVVMAAGGTGKTYFLCGVAANVSRGIAPLGNPDPPEKPQNVLFISGEDRGGELRDRMEASGGDLSHIYVIDCVESAGLDLSADIDEFSRLISKAQAKLVIIDPWQSFIGRDVDINRINILRPVLQAISNLAKRNKCAVVLVSHVSKKVQTENINNAAIGSADFINAARSALTLTFTDEKNERLMLHTKSNYSEPGQTIRFGISKEKGVEWLGYSEIDRPTLEASVRAGKPVAQVLREKSQEREALQPLSQELLRLAEPGKRKKITYDELRERCGEDIFADLQPIRALEKAAALVPTCGLSIKMKNGIRVVGEDGKATVRRGFELYQNQAFCVHDPDRRD